MATATVKPAKHYQARPANDFLGTSRKNTLAAASLKKNKLERWVKKWSSWLIEK